MDVTRKKRIKRDWPAIFNEFHESGLSVTEFCRTKGISQSLFYLRRKDCGNANDVNGRVKTGDPHNPPSLRLNDFIQLKSVSSSRMSASIVFGGQIELSVSNDCDKDLLRHIISQLKGSPC